MTGEITSPSLGENRMPAMPGSPREQWKAFFSFSKAPRLPENRGSFQDGARATLRMLSLDLAFLVVYVGALMTVVAIGFTLPENLNSTLTLDLQTVLLIVIGAPIAEELVFRSWLSGRPRYLVAFPIFFVATIAAMSLTTNQSGEQAQAIIGLCIIAAILATIIAALVLRKKPTPDWFKPIFPAAVWISSAGFALVHFVNYTEGSLLILLPLVLPQFVLGSIAAYLRIHYGFWTAMAVHAAHNGIAIGIASLAMASESGAA